MTQGILSNSLWQAEVQAAEAFPEQGKRLKGKTQSL